MNPERWHRIEEVFRTVAECPEDEREAYLTRACGGDDDLRREVLSLLAQDTSEDFLRSPLADLAASTTAVPPSDLTGTQIGPYRLVRLVGRGGMGAVYEAVRDDEQFRQQVALKLIKRGMDSDFVRRRFLRERQILASLDHPYIARLLDGGATTDGQPYFVMEFVAGEPITEYCRRHALSLEDKLKLFRAVCAAVQHAHQKLVVHRDLKPSNILVTEDGATQLPKLLDFGIAKLLSPDPGTAETRTETAMRLMTPEYASPEQVHGDQITTATDIYSLGVVLYELLTEQRPFQFETYSPAAIERAICNTEAPRPSEAARQQHSGQAKLARQLAGDLDNIVLMALRKEPARRYQSVEQFAEDIRRYLVGLPVAARNDTFNYRAGKFVRRHKASVAILTLLIALTAAMAIQSLRIARERDRANQAAATAQAVEQSLVAVFEFADPGQSRRKAITAEELLDQGAEKVARDLRNQPVVQAKLFDTLGGLYQSIGAYERAEQLLAESLKLRRQTLGAQHADVAASLHHLAALTDAKGDYAAAETGFREALAMRRTLFGAEHKDVADSMKELGTLLLSRGRPAEAEPLLRESLAMRRALFGAEHKDVADSLIGLGRLLSEQGKFAEAAEIYRQSLVLHRKLYGNEHPLIATGLNNRAAMLQELGDYNGAEPLFREALALRRKVLGPEHPDIVFSLANLASLMQDKRQYDEAEQLYRQAIELRRKLFGENHPGLTTTMNNLATLLKEKGDLAGAEDLFRQSLALRRRLFGEEHPETAATLANVGNCVLERGQYHEALQIFRQSLDLLLKSQSPNHWTVHRARSFLGGALVKLKRYREAEEQLLAAHTGLKAARGDEHILTRQTVSRLIELYEAWGQPDQAAPYRLLPQSQPRR